MRHSFRRGVKAKTRDLEAKFPQSVRFTIFSRPEDLAQVLVDVEAVAAKTYHRGLGTGFKSDDEHKRILEMEAKAGRLRACILYGADAPRAFLIGFVYGETFYGVYTGYEPGLREYDLGTLVFIHLIDRLCEEKVKVFDFGLGDAFYKRRLADRCWNDVSISIYRPSLRGAALKLAFTGCLYFDQFLRSVGQRLKLVNWVKRAWRSQLARGRAESQD
jgi:CelD/BcsL family acetyltransferase involved in cellulose biosynthesis